MAFDAVVGMSAIASAWASMEDILSPAGVIAVGTFVVHEIAWLLFNLPYLMFDRFGLFQSQKLSEVRRCSLFARLSHCAMLPSVFLPNRHTTPNGLVRLLSLRLCAPHSTRKLLN